MRDRIRIDKEDCGRAKQRRCAASMRSQAASCRLQHAWRADTRAIPDLGRVDQGMSTSPRRSRACDT